MFEPRLEHVTFVKADPGSRWIQAEVQCNCSFMVLWVPYAEGWFDSYGRILDYMSSSTDGISTSSTHRDFTLDEGRSLNFHWVDSEQGQRVHVNVSDARTGGYTDHGQVRTLFFYVPWGDIEELSLQIETNRSDVPIRTFSGPGLPYASPTDFTKDDSRYSRLELQMAGSMRVELTPSQDLAEVDISRVPTYRIETAAGRSTFTRKESDPLYWHHEQAQAKRSVEVQAPPGPVRIELEFQADVKPEDRIYPFVFTEPLRTNR